MEKINFYLIKIFLHFPANNNKHEHDQQQSYEDNRHPNYVGNLKQFSLMKQPLGDFVFLDKPIKSFLPSEQRFLVFHQQGKKKN